MAVHDVVLERDAFRFQFASGVFQFLAPVEGRVTGAVFIGDGSMEVRPAIDAERRQLALVTGERQLSILSERFDSAVIFFSDATVTEIEKQTVGAEPPPRAGEVYENFFQKQRKDLRSNFQLRLLRALLENNPASGVFLAFLPGKKYPPLLALSDPLGVGWFTPHYLLSGEESALFALSERGGGLWYLAHAKSETGAGPSHSARALTRSLHYAVETTIQRNADVRGTATIQAKPLQADMRVLPLQLLGRLRIREASFSETDEGPRKPVAVIQEDAKEDCDAAIVFPAPLAIGKTFFLRIVYEGKEVLRDAGDGNYIVGARENWYPTLGALFDKGQIGRLGVLSLTGTTPASIDATIRLPKQPRRLLLNAYHDVLSRD